MRALANGPHSCDNARVFEPLHDPPDQSHGTHRYVLVAGHKLLVQSAAEGDTVCHALPSLARVAVAAKDAPVAAKDALPLGRVGDVTYWARAWHQSDELPDGYRLSGLRGLFASLPALEWNIAGRATQMLRWRRNHRYCGRCGVEMASAPGERAMRCPSDGYTAYPRISPAVIVLVERGDGRALLAKNGRHKLPMYSTLAGFVEPGESLEDTIHREIREEVGVEVEDIAYFGSQPWPFPDSLMIGFTARWASGDIAIDGVEIADAQWFTHDELPPIPPSISIARQLINAWVARSCARDVTKTPD